jgi:hypothetical protein
MNYLKKLKALKEQKPKNKPTQLTVKTAKSTYDSFGSTISSCFPGNLKPNKIIVFETSLHEQIDHLWEKAWKLADWIDNPQSNIHWQERKKYLPEVFKMSARIGELEEQIKTRFENLPDGGKKYKDLEGVWYPYKKIEINILTGDNYA